MPAIPFARFDAMFVADIVSFFSSIWKSGTREETAAVLVGHS
jgi:hypothetical protein